MINLGLVFIFNFLKVVTEHESTFKALEITPLINLGYDKCLKSPVSNRKVHT